MPIPFPEMFAPFMPLIMQAWHASHIHPLQVFQGGLSGAAVFLVDIQSAVHKGTAVLKFECLDRRSNQAEDEKELYERVHRDAPLFAAAHIPRVLASFRRDNTSAVLITLAGGSYTEFQQFACIEDDETRRRVLQRLCRAVLNWNENDDTFHPDPDPPTELFRSWLGDRLGERGNIPVHLDELGVRPNAPAFQCGDFVLPNPYLFAVEPDRWADLKIVSFKGPQHLDLHVRNILVRLLRRGSNDFFLIDLLYQPQQFLFFDTAYLELSLLLHDRPGATREQWLRLLDAVAGQSHRRHGTNDAGLVKLIHTLRTAEEKWREERQPDRKDHVLAQRLLARVAVGLNYLNKRSASQATRYAGLVFAAYHLKQCLDQFGLTWSRDTVGTGILVPA